jgi:hypothetical protein
VDTTFALLCKHSLEIDRPQYETMLIKLHHYGFEREMTPSLPPLDKKQEQPDDVQKGNGSKHAYSSV